MGNFWKKRHCVSKRPARIGAVLVMLAIALPMVIAILALVLDGGLMMDQSRNLQHVTDAAATAAAMDLRLGKSQSDAMATAIEFIHDANKLPDATVAVNIPPVNGRYAGEAGYVEVL